MRLKRINLAFVVVLFFCAFNIVFGFSIPTYEWQKVHSSGYSGWEVMQTPDRGYIACGYTNISTAGGDDGFVIKTDSSGNRIWSKTIGGPNHDGFYAMARIPGGGYIFVGLTQLQANWNSADAYIVITDANGTIITQKNYGTTDKEERLNAICTSVAGDAFISVGWSASYDTSYSPPRLVTKDIYIINIDLQGNKIWDKYINIGVIDEAFDVKQTIDGNFIVLGTSDNNIILLKISCTGSILWQKNYDFNVNEKMYALIQTQDGGFLLTGEATIGGKKDVMLIKVNELGEVEDMRFYGGPQDDWARAIVQSPDGKYILAGGTSSYGAGSSDVYLLKVDQNLNLEYQTTVGTSREDWANDIKPTADFGYIITGYTNTDLYLVKFAGSPLEFDFEGNTDGWTFFGKVEPFDLPSSSASNGRLGLSPAGSTNSFSFWQSPPIAITPSRKYKFTFSISSTVADTNSAPDFRIRVNQIGCWAYWERIIYSEGGIGPQSSQSTDYTLIFQPIGNREVDYIRLSFDIMGFEPANNNNAWLYLNNVKLEQTF